jgi:hypothetical protein
MRRSRGTKMAALEQQEGFDDLDENDFWKDNKYFGKIEEVSENEADEEQDSYERDEEEHSDSYDKDFGDVSSNSSGNEYDSDGEVIPVKGQLRKRGHPDKESPGKGLKASIGKLSSTGKKSTDNKFSRFQKKKKKSSRNRLDMDISNEVRKTVKKVKTHERFKKKVIERTSWKANFIHESFNQEDLLRNAVYEEQLNRISLEKMIWIEEKKKKQRAFT